MSQSVYFNGELITIPGAYSSVDVSAMSTKRDGEGSKIIAILGECTGGEPGVIQFFDEPTAAKKVLKSGELLKACEKAWDPVSRTKEGVKLGGANTIACIRTNTATKSKHEIKAKVDDPTAQIVFESKDWGDNTRHQIKMSDGSLNNTKKVVVYDQTKGTYETYDNVGNLFSMSYTGSAAYAELNVFLDGNDSMFLQTKVGEDAATAQEDIKIKLDPKSIKTLKGLINQLQSYENYTVSSTNPYNNKLIVTDLDFVTKQSIKLDAGQTAHRVTAVYADLKNKFDTISQLVRVSSFDKSKGTIENFDYITLDGGVQGTSPASWVYFFDMLSNFDIFYIVPLTHEVSIHAELASHITTLSGNLGKERRGVVGGTINETVAETLQRARDLASSRVQVVHGGFYDYNSDNELELYAPYVLAAQHAGRAAFLEDGESATHDTYRMSVPEYKLERTELTQLLAGGCLAFEFVLGRNSTAQSFVRLVHDLTTDTTSSDTVHTERATGALADSINKEIRDELDNLLTGKRTAVADLTSAKNRVISILANRKRKSQIIDYKDVYVTKVGTVTEIDYSVAPAEPNNFTLITAHYYSETIAAE